MRRRNRTRNILAQKAGIKFSFRRVVFSSIILISAFTFLFLYFNLWKSKKTFGNSGIVLQPVKLKNFTGEASNNSAELNWITESEISNDYFTIERSRDGYDYYEIGKILGAGSSTVETLYKFTDGSPLKGDIYYRLTETNYDGSRIKFKPVHLSFTNSVEEGFYISYAGPNPFEDNLRVDYNSKEPGILEISLVNLKGQTMRSEQVISEEGMNTFFFGDVESLEKGIYFIQLLQDDGKAPVINVLKK